MIEKSGNGTDYLPVGKVDSKQNNSVNNYSFIDSSSHVNTQNLFYRLKIINYDRSYTYSPVARVSFGQNGEIHLFPNPATTQFSVVGRDVKQIGITDIWGRMVLSKTMSSATEIVDISPLAKGIYFVQMTDKSGQSIIEKIVVQ